MREGEYCHRNAWLGAYPSKAQVAIRGTEHAQEYQFGRRRFMGHPFCKTCGVHVYMNVHGPPQHVVDGLPEFRKALVRQNMDIAPINVRTLDGIQISHLTVQRINDGTDGYEEDVLNSQ